MPSRIPADRQKWLEDHEELCETASEGPWEIPTSTLNGKALHIGPIAGYDGTALDLSPIDPDALFVAAAREALPAALAEIRRLDGEIKVLHLGLQASEECRATLNHERSLILEDVKSERTDCSTPLFQMVRNLRARAEKANAEADLNDGWLKKHCEERDLAISRERDAILALTVTKVALAKINAIRNSIIGRQAINWSDHIYPLVAALNEAGVQGEGYDISRAKAKVEAEAYNKLRETVISVRDELRGAHIPSMLDLASMAHRLDEVFGRLT